MGEKHVMGLLLIECQVLCVSLHTSTVAEEISIKQPTGSKYRGISF